MKVLLLLVALTLGLWLPQPVTLAATPSPATQQARRAKKARHIWQRNSQKRASFLCRDGAISHSKTSRGACSHHGGIKRRL